MWNAHFGSRSSLANDTHANANGVVTEEQIAQYEAAKAEAISRVAAKVSADVEVAVSIVGRDDGEVSIYVEPVVDQGEGPEA